MATNKDNLDTRMANQGGWDAEAEFKKWCYAQPGDIRVLKMGFTEVDTDWFLYIHPDLRCLPDYAVHIMGNPWKVAYCEIKANYQIKTDHLAAYEKFFKRYASVPGHRLFLVVYMRGMYEPEFYPIARAINHLLGKPIQVYDSDKKPYQVIDPNTCTPVPFTPEVFNDHKPAAPAAADSDMGF